MHYRAFFANLVFFCVLTTSTHSIISKRTINEVSKCFFSYTGNSTRLRALVQLSWIFAFLLLSCFTKVSGFLLILGEIQSNMKNTNVRMGGCYSECNVRILQLYLLFQLQTTITSTLKVINGIKPYFPQQWQYWWTKLLCGTTVFFFPSSYGVVSIQQFSFITLYSSIGLDPSLWFN